MELQMQLTAFLTAANILLLLGIIGLNIYSYRRIKAEYTLFVLLFASVFLVENVVSGYFMFTNMDFYIPEVANHMLFVTGLETVAFAVLLWMQRQ